MESKLWADEMPIYVLEEFDSCLNLTWIMNTL